MARQAAYWLRGTGERPREDLIRDALIAATAAARGEVIYTRNVRDFQRFYARVKVY
jgi:predicted nucleic acid-binding protein